METPNARPVRSAIGLGVSIAVAASGLTALAAPAAHAAAVHPAAIAKATSTAVHASAVHIAAAAPAGSVGQGPLTSDCTTTGGRTSCDIWAKIGSVSVHDSASTTKQIPVWNFVSTSGAAATGGSSVLIGTVGQPIDITMHNTLPQRVGFSVPQVDGFVPDTTGIAQDTSKTYTFTPTRAGSYIYQAGLTVDGDRQVAMGLAGALVVRPADAATSDYDVAQRTFDDEAVMVYQDIDENFAADPAGFNMRHYDPQYHLLNGVAYPDGAPIITDAGRTLMLHFVNISQLDKSPTLLGTRMTAFARGARPMASIMDEAGRMITPGDTVDASMVMPAGTHRYSIYNSPGVLNNGNWVNGTDSQAIGGGLTFIQSGGSGTDAPTGAAVFKFAAAGQPGGVGRPLTMSANLDTANRGGGDIAQAEYYVDTFNDTPGTGTAIAVAGTSPLAVSWPLDVSTLTSGTHTAYVRAQDSFGAWGPLVTLAFKVDATGPVVNGVVMSSTTTNRVGDITVSATANDTTTGGSYSTAARYWIDGSATPPANPVTMTTNGPRVIASVDGTIPQASLTGLAEGAHTLYIQAQDSLGLWGAATPTSFIVDLTAPVTSAATVKPGATNGVSVCDLTGAGANPGMNIGNACLTTPAAPGQFLLTADAIDPVTNGVHSSIDRVEAFLMACNPTCPALPAAASKNALQLSPAGAGATPGSTHYTGLIPLSWVAAYANTTVTIKVVALDAAGNRVDGGTSAKIIVDKTKPTVTNVGASLVQGTWTMNAAAAPNAANYTNDASAVLTVPATDGTAGAQGVSGVAAGEYFIGADPGVGLGRPMTVTGNNLTATLDLNALALTNGGSVTVNVRSQDFANNWSALTTVTATLVPVTVFASDLESTTTSPWSWTAVSGTLTRVNTTPIATGTGYYLNAAPTGTNTAYVSRTVPTTGTPAIGTRFSAHETVATTSVTRTSATGNTYVTVMQGMSGNTGATSSFQVQYARFGTTVQFRAVVGTTTGNWVTVPTGTGVFAVSADYTAGGANGANRGALVIKVNATTLATSYANTNNQRITRIRMGVVANTSTSAPTMKFDSFVSARVPF